jgi:prepilin-type N-terminal cleavage/methylation domain-containing protein/prepilin-type processing-associated H-X9-DG protein
VRPTNGVDVPAEAFYNLPDAIASSGAGRPAGVSIASAARSANQTERHGVTDMVHTRTRRRGFTLVELLVVIGIIALLISILLPALNRARDSASTIACGANLRTMGQTLRQYHDENKSSLPWAYYLNTSAVTAQNTVNDASADDTRDKATYVWWSVIRGYIRKNGIYDNSTLLANGSRSNRYMDLFECRNAKRRDLGNDFNVNPILMPTIMQAIPTNIDAHSRNARYTRPYKYEWTYPDNIVMYDAAEIAPDFSTQFLHGYDLDGGMYSNAKIPVNLYRPFAATEYDNGNDPNLEFSNDSPINPGSNKDYTGSSGDSQAGNIRWRHARETSANFLFVDGSVRTLTISKNANTPSAKGDVLRKYFRPKPIPGMTPDSD